MIILLDTSTAVCRLTMIGKDWRHDTEWQADRELARGLPGYLEAQLAAKSMDFSDITGIGALKGPGSFTGLRIGLTVLNTLADALGVPIVGATGENWQTEAIAKLEAGENERVVLPLYGSDARITAPRK